MDAPLVVIAIDAISRSVPTVTGTSNFAVFVACSAVLVWARYMSERIESEHDEEEDGSNEDSNDCRYLCSTPE